MIIASAGYYGLMPRFLELLGAHSAATALYAFQATLPGLLTYGLLVFCMEFLPFGAVNPQEVSEYFNAVGVEYFLGGWLAVRCARVVGAWGRLCCGFQMYCGGAGAAC